MKKVKNLFRKQIKVRGPDTAKLDDEDHKNTPPMATKPATSSSNLIVSVAFDFGTTYSGYAFSFRDDPLKVQTNQAWNAATEQLISLKTPTCVLLNPKGEFAKFGFEAENKYVELAEEGEHEGWRLFRRFKMMLHQNQRLSRESTVEDITGKSMRALPIFAMAIGFLRGHMLEAISNQKIGFLETDIQYVVTVPAIWYDAAKQFMREAAILAGIATDRLKLCLEPEAASIWCEQIDSNAKEALSSAGTQYMVVDLGGGTADISVHERKCDGTLKEVHAASGGPWGGIYVDKNYMKALGTMFGEHAIHDLKSNRMDDYFDILREFESKKRSVSMATGSKLVLRISTALRELSQKYSGGQTIEQTLASRGYGDRVVIKGDKLRIDQSLVQEWFDGPINKVIQHINEVLSDRNMKSVQSILLVGGFGESRYVQERIRKDIGNKRLVVPDEAGMVVLKGAVRFGHEPDIVSSRTMKYTYGMCFYDMFNPQRHLSHRMEIINGKECMPDAFLSFVRIGDEVKIDEEVTKRSLKPQVKEKTWIEIYRSSDADPIACDDPTCEYIGRLTIYHPEGDTLAEKKFDITFIFGDTELIVKARLQKTGKNESVNIDCLK